VEKTAAVMSRGLPLVGRLGWGGQLFVLAGHWLARASY
jgi:hypothetical protein